MTQLADPIPPARAIVVPRGTCADGGETLPLDMHARRLLRRHPIVAVVGPPGAGKTVALAHLAAAMPDVDCRDEPNGLFAVALAGRPTIIARTEPPALLSVVALAPWGEAERIDYLLARHPTRIRAVMEQLKACDCADALEGSPRLWALVLDAIAERGLAGDGVEAFLRRRMDHELKRATHRDDVRATMAYALSTTGRATRAEGVPRVLRHRVFGQLAFADEAIDGLSRSPLPALWHRLVDPALIALVARRLRDRPDARATLDRLLAERPSPAIAPALASIVSIQLALDPTYRPPPTALRLAHVYAPGARWAGIAMPNAVLADARLADADLSGATLDHASLRRADLAGATLSGASLAGANLHGATLVDASLANASLRHANLGATFATAAAFDGADLAGANLGGSDLRGASLRRANLSDAVLSATQVAAADLTGASLEGVRCRDSIDWRDAVLNGVRARDGNFTGGVFEGMTIAEIDFTIAGLIRADLTGSTLRRATLTGAALIEAGVADVDWEGCDLRGADFTRAAFHMGSSRSGMLDSPVACEGSRTGFYTHDDGLPHFQPPEQIRKANLCGCDLRGAIVSGTDWYLVDLRRARYDDEQADWFRRCGAILA